MGFPYLQISRFYVKYSFQLSWKTGPWLHQVHGSAWILELSAAAFSLHTHFPVSHHPHHTLLSTSLPLNLFVLSYSHMAQTLEASVSEVSHQYGGKKLGRPRCILRLFYCSQGGRCTLWDAKSPQKEDEITRWDKDLFSFLFSFWLSTWHVEVPGPGIKSTP